MKIEDIKKDDLLVRVYKRDKGYYRVLKINKVTIKVRAVNGKETRVSPLIFERKIKYPRKLGLVNGRSVLDGMNREERRKYRAARKAILLAEKAERQATLTDGRHCYYCGDLARGDDLHRDHKKPVSLGGTSHPRNIVFACSTCNCIKGQRIIKDARLSLLQKRFGWPKFTKVQLEWLKNRGFDTSPIDDGKLAFEERSS